MSYVTVSAEIDLDEVLDDVDEETLAEALENRRRSNPGDLALWDSVVRYFRQRNCECAALRELIYARTGQIV